MTRPSVTFSRMPRKVGTTPRFLGIFVSAVVFLGCGSEASSEPCDGATDGGSACEALAEPIGSASVVGRVDPFSAEASIGTQAYVLVKTGPAECAFSYPASDEMFSIAFPKTAPVLTMLDATDGVSIVWQDIATVETSISSRVQLARFGSTQIAGEFYAVLPSLGPVHGFFNAPVCP